MNTQNKKLKHRIKTLMRKMTKTAPFMEGTLAITERMCGGEGCVCRRGKKHKAMYLTWKEDQKTRSMYVPVGRQKEAQLMSQNYKQLKKLIRKLSNFHKKALTHKERI